MNSPAVRFLFLVVIWATLSVFALAQSPFESGSRKKIQVSETGWKAKAYMQLSLTQKQLRDEIAGIIRKNRGSVFSLAFLLLIGLSFLYGVVHAIGPGHGKSIVMSYMLSEEPPTLIKGISAGTIIAFGEAISAIVIVYGIYFLSLGRIGPGFSAAELKIKTGAYLFILLIGLILLLYRIKKHSKILVKKSKSLHSDHQPRKSGMLVAASLGIIPCPGVRILLLFSLAMKFTLTGIILALSMALGMAITISGFGLSMMVFKTRLLGVFSSDYRRLESIKGILGLAGAAMIVILAFVMLLI